MDSLLENHNKFIKDNKLILKSQQKFTSKKHNIITEEVKNLIVLSANDDKRLQSIDSIETYACGTSKDLVYNKKEIKCNNMIKQYKND